MGKGREGVKVILGVPVGLCLLASLAYGQTVTVTGSVNITRPAKAKADHSGLVVSLQAMPAVAGAGKHQPPATFTVVQKDKLFDPHVLAVPVGSLVAFPNFDPFFHNVFSMFDGRRFDLGLYEAGASRTAAFPKAGVCYIFCNIHPEMTAVIVVVDTPYVVVTNTSGKFTIPNVPAGRYRVTVWHERAQLATKGEYPHDVTISAETASLGVIQFVDSGQLTVPHKNKYGRDYDSPSNGPNYK